MRSYFARGAAIAMLAVCAAITPPGEWHAWIVMASSTVVGFAAGRESKEGGA